MAESRAASKGVLAQEAWRSLFEFFIRTRGSRDRQLTELGLTPNDAKALGSLSKEQGRPMSTLAEVWGTDASNATWVVDRLEKQGLAERKAAEGDRRVKLVVLTEQGVKTKTALMKAFHEPPPQLLDLSREELKSLKTILQKLEASLPPKPW